MSGQDRKERLAAKPEPVASIASQPFWDGCAAGEIRLPRCRSCGTAHFYPRPFCPHCGADDITWIRAAGTGTVWASTVVHSSFWGDAWADDLPYNVAIVELDEGVRLVSNVLGVAPGNVRIGARVRVGFVRRGATALPVFHLLDAPVEGGTDTSHGSRPPQF